MTWRKKNGPTSSTWRIVPEGGFWAGIRRDESPCPGYPPVRGVGMFGGTEFQGREGSGRSFGSHRREHRRPGGDGGYQILPPPLEVKGDGRGLAVDPVAHHRLRNGAGLPGRRLFSRETSFQEASFPTFSGTLSTYGRKPLVLCRLDGAPWEKLPEEGGEAGFRPGTGNHLRIYSPFHRGAQKRMTGPERDKGRGKNSRALCFYSTVTLIARFRGWSM